MDVPVHQDVRGEGEEREEKESIRVDYVANTIILCKLEFLCACTVLSSTCTYVLREGVNVSLVLTTVDGTGRLFRTSDTFSSFESSLFATALVENVVTRSCHHHMSWPPWPWKVHCYSASPYAMKKFQCLE
jgi:hypothetical protein